MAETVRLDGPQMATAYVVDASVLDSLAENADFEADAIELTRAERERYGSTPVFKERKPLYGLTYKNDLFGVTSIGEAGVRTLLGKGETVAIHARRTADKLAGYSGVELFLPAHERFQVWSALTRAGLDVSFDADWRIVNLNIDDHTPMFADGQVAVTVGQQGNDIACTVTQGALSHTWLVYGREHHSYETLSDLTGRRIDKAVLAHHESFTNRGSHYYKLYLIV